MTTPIRNPSVFSGVAVALGLITLLGPASIDMYLPSMPAMAGELQTDYSTVQITLTVFLLALGGGQLIFGPLIDALGRRRPLLFAVVTFVCASLWSALAQSVEILIVARLVQGLAASLAVVTAMSSVRDVAEGVRATQLFALLMTIQGLGPVLAPAAGGLIGSAFGWRTVFLVLGGLGIVVLLSSIVLLPESLPIAKRAPLRFKEIGKTYGEIVTDKRFLLPAMSLAGAFIFLFAYIGGSSFAYQELYGISSTSFGLVFGGTGLAVLFGAMASAKLAARVSVEKLAAAGASAILFGALIALVSASAPVGLYGIVPGMFIALGGLGIAETTLMSIALSTRNTALGASAAVLGAGPMILGAAATPISAFLVEQGAIFWTALLFGIALVTVLLTLASARMIRQAGVVVAVGH
ncbi:MFS transporter, DHA1 family, bicyclomycin/chloramphenicol resistance protein [Devosia crocina]|uniref:Bcr/CflA family efflux transporter n=1 Tax=Devosia crocina TaxID=429728 RepID=A0A1I7MYV4_9HYPH|nr:multidrug effflux MFS transporter [Devosia crocina]SFV27587.1 MFS transporter, DHA1 family, bicyclomycin/chloramphenicol resistance protein [Devosia crocina]